MVVEKNTQRATLWSVLLNKYCSGVRIKKNEMGRTCGMYTGRKVHPAFGGCGAVGWGTTLQAGSSRFRLPIGGFCTMALRSTQPLTETSTRNISWGVKAAERQIYQLHVPIVLKSESLDLLEPSGPVQACNGFSLPISVCIKTQRGQNFWKRMRGWLCNIVMYLNNLAV
jgi:hypothetical protein